eukprot:gene7597-11016_t
MEPERMRLEQLLAYRELRAGVVAGRVPVSPTNCAYQPGVSHGTAHRLNQACQLDARRRLKELFIPRALVHIQAMAKTKTGDISRVSVFSDGQCVAVVAQDLLRFGMRPDVAFRTVVFWAFALIHTITAAGLTAAYTEDHAGIQGDMFAQLMYLVYVYAGYEAGRALGIGYEIALHGQPSIQIPMISFSDDNAILANTLLNLTRIATAERRALRPRLLTNDPGKEGVLGLVWRKVDGVWRPRTLGADALQIKDQGSSVPLIRLTAHTRNYGFELI